MAVQAAGGAGGSGEGGRPTATGGLGGSNDERARREYERERVRLVGSWVRGVTRRLSVELQEAVKQEFGLSGVVWHGAFKYKLSQARISRLRSVVRKMYEETQVDLAAKGIVQVDLFRGVGTEYRAKRVLESWTSNRIVAGRFGEYTVLTESVPANRVFLYHDGPGWQVGPLGDQQEYLVMGGGHE